MKLLTGFIFWVVLSVAGGAAGDVVHLKDGTTLEGDVKKTPDGWVVRQADGTLTPVQAGDIGSIELKGVSPSPDRALATNFTSLRRAIDNSIDPKQAIERYQRFIDQNPQTPQVEEARKEIGIWQDRQARNLVKWQTQWLTADEVKQRIQSATDRAEEARQLLKQGRVKEADAILAKVLADDPANPTAMYLHGVALYRQEQLGPAKKQFETLAGILKDHAPTLNNAAVVLWRQKRYPESLNFFDQAMVASPKNKTILSNVAEALNELPDNQRSGQVVQKITRHFNEQDNELQTELSAAGWYRWGATWVNQQQLDDLRARQKEIDTKLSAMAQEFDATRQRIDRMDRDIDDTERSVRRIEAASYARDLNGNLVRIAFPPLYYELQDDANRQRALRASELTKLDALRNGAAAMKQQGPTPKFTGIQRIIDVEGTPMLKLPTPVLSTAPATQPTTMPAPTTTASSQPATSPGGD